MIANDANYWTLEFKSDLGRIKNSMQLYLFFIFFCRLTLILSCSMNFRSYPHDTQECSMKIESCEYQPFSFEISGGCFLRSITWFAFIKYSTIIQMCWNCLLFDWQYHTRPMIWCSGGPAKCHWWSTISNYHNSTWRRMSPVTALSHIQQVNQLANSHFKVKMLWKTKRGNLK